MVANGCSDDTAELARAVPGVTVLELGAASKAVALDAGDRAATAFPRVFLDADIEVSAPTLRALAAALPDDVARLAAPRVAFDDVGADPLVRSFYRAYTRLPYMTAAMTGTGVYAVSRAGRARFDRFPELTADDLFVQRLFSEQERTVLAQTFTVRIPRSFGALVRVRTRVAAGNRQLAAARPGDDAFAASTAGTGRALADLVRSQPRLFPDAVVYTGVTALARTRARRAGAGTWQRDETSRGADPGGGGADPAATRAAPGPREPGRPRPLPGRPPADHGRRRPVLGGDRGRGRRPRRLRVGRRARRVPAHAERGHPAPAAPSGSASPGRPCRPGGRRRHARGLGQPAGGDAAARAGHRVLPDLVADPGRGRGWSTGDAARRARRASQTGRPSDCATASPAWARSRPTSPRSGSTAIRCSGLPSTGRSRRSRRTWCSSVSGSPGRSA